MHEPLPFLPKRALAIGAHPDDVEYFAGGTVIRLGAEGCATALVVASDGAQGGRDLADAPAVRRAEQTKAADALGVDAWTWLGHPDGALVPGDAMRGELAGAVPRLRPELVLTPDPRTFFAVTSTESVKALGLREGDSVSALINASHVLIAVND